MSDHPSPSATKSELAHTAPLMQGSSCQFKTYQHTRRKDGRVVIDEQSDAPCSSDEPDVDASYALIIRRVFNEKHELSKVILRINSPHILAAFRDVIGSYPTVAADFSGPFQLESPFQMLVHSWDRLDTHRGETDCPLRRMHLNLLFRFMEQEIGPDRTAVLTMLRNRMITYKLAWVIFRPGDLVYTEVMDKPWLLRVHSTAYEQSSSYGPHLTVYTRYCDANGEAVGKAAKSIQILQKKHFASEHPAVIDSLSIYPREFHRRGGDLEEELSARGRKFIENRGVLTRDYDGLAEYLKDPRDPGDDWVPFIETGRVVLDRKTFEDDNHYRRVKVQAQDELELMLCPPYSMGYSLDRKAWCRYLVDSLYQVAWKDDAWKTLLLDEEEKAVLQALVTSHRYPGNPRNQPEQKGKGLVFLLHGTPGTGKTLSAETSAEMSRKALFSASLGDLNRYNSAWLFERKLKQILQYATLWQAIVLLDEADVFLEARETGSGAASRNALVAVFLKELEYFSGIVFLTTNRLATFDAAMKSRVHLALRFVPPTRDKRYRLWRQKLATVPADETAIGEGAAADNAANIFKQYDLNGRDICNALNTARTLARFEGVRVDVPHVQRVLKVRQTFDTHLREESQRLIRAGGTEGPEAFRLVKRDSIMSQHDQAEDDN